MAPPENTQLCSLTPTDGSKLALPRQTHSDSSHAPKSMGVTFKGWRHAGKEFISWAHKLSKKHQHTWRKAGIFEAIMASTKKIHKDLSLIFAVAEKWCPKTNTFIFPWGEVTITLEDVMVLLGFSVLGLPHFASLESTEEKRTKKKLEKACVQIKKEKGFSANQVTWVSTFMDSGHELEHVAFLALWVSYFVFPSRSYQIDEALLPIAVHLSCGRRMALAPAVLSHLYADLSLLRNQIRDVNESTIPLKIDPCALFKLVQVWTWERFRELQLPKPMLKGDPRLALWHDLDTEARKASNARQVLEESSLDSFEWRPYTTPVENWKIPQFYPEKAMWVPVDSTNIDEELISYARCIRVSQLVGIDCVEHYFPNRVASQFGMVQENTCPVNKKHLSQDEAWRNYDKPIDDLVLYIPSRSSTPEAAPRMSQFLQLQWSSMENRVVEPDETLTPGGNSTSFVHPDAEMGGTSKDGMNITKESMNKKRPREVDESSMVRVQTHVPSDNDDEEADRLTSAQWPKRRFNKKYNYMRRSRGDASKRSGVEANDNNDSGPCHNLASIRDETVLVPEIEQMNKVANETRSNEGSTFVPSTSDGNNFSSPPDDELDVLVSNADENTMIDDDSMGPDYLLLEQDDGEKTETNESESQAAEINVLITSDENNFSISVGFDGAIGTAVSPLPETRQACDDKLDAHGSNANENTMIDDGSKEPDCLLNEDGGIAGDDGYETEQRHEETNEGGSKAAEVNIPMPADENKSSDPLLASEGASEDRRSKAHKSMGLIPSDENNFSRPVGFDVAAGIVVSPPETVKTCDYELEVHGSNADENTLINDGILEPDCLLHEPDGVIAEDGEETEQRVQGTSEGVREAAESNIRIPSDENNSSVPRLASEGANEDEGSQAHKSMGLSSSDNSNTHLNLGDQTQRQGCLPHDHGLGNEETMKSKEHLEYVGKMNDEGGDGDDSVKQSLLNIKAMAKDMEVCIMKVQEVQKKVAWLKARKAMKQRNVTAARLGR